MRGWDLHPAVQCRKWDGQNVFNPAPWLLLKIIVFLRVAYSINNVGLCFDGALAFENLHDISLPSRVSLIARL